MAASHGDLVADSRDGTDDKIKKREYRVGRYPHSYLPGLYAVRRVIVTCESTGHQSSHGYDRYGLVRGYNSDVSYCAVIVGLNGRP